MTVAVDVVDGTGLVADQDAVKALVRSVLESEAVSGEVVVAFLTEAAVAELNERYRDAAGPTDVLSFREAASTNWPDEAGSGRSLGEIAVCPSVVIRYAREEGRDPRLQLAWTLIHGALHLAGYDHETDHGEMREREQLLLAQLQELVRPLALAEDADRWETRS